VGKGKVCIICFFLFFYAVFKISAQEYSADFIAHMPTPGEYSLFATSGWDGNWYVGGNRRWVGKLPGFADAKDYDRVFVGARLGRAKHPQRIKEVLEEKEIEGNEGPYDIFIGLSGSRREKPSGRLLTDTGNIPMEGLEDRALVEVGESRWFWVEIDREDIPAGEDRYIHLWSPDKELSLAAVSPILAAAEGLQKDNATFLIEDGEVKNISFFSPAIAIKAVTGEPPEPSVEIREFRSHPSASGKKVVLTRVKGDAVSEVILEVNAGGGWEIMDSVYSPPYDISFDVSDFEAGKYRIRCRAKNWWGETAVSGYEEFEIKDEE